MAAYPSWVKDWADFYTKHGQPISPDQLWQNVQWGNSDASRGQAADAQIPLGADINANTGRRAADASIDPNGTAAGDLASYGQWKISDIQHGPNNFMERLASYSPYIIGAMAGYGALGASGALGAEAAAGGGTGTLSASSVPAANVTGSEIGLLGSGGAAAPAAGYGGVSTAAGATPWTQYAASGGSLLGAGGAGGAGGAVAPAAGGTAATSGLGSMSNLFGTGLGVSDIAPLAGAIGGALQGGQDQTSTQTRTGDPALAGLQQQLINQSIMAASQPFQAAPGFNADQQAAFQQIRNQQNSPLMQAGSDALIRQMQPGDNPYLQGVVDKSSADIAKQFNNTVVPNLDAMNIRANSGFGTSSAINGGQPDSLRQNAYTSLNDTTANSANNLRFQDYTAQQNRSLQAAGMVPGFNAMNTGNTQALLNVGNQQQGFANQEFMRQQQWPQQQMQLLGYPMGFSQGGSSSSTTPGVGPWAGGISGLLGGIGMGNTLGQTPPPANPMMGQTYGSPTYPQSYPPGYTTPWGTP